MIRVLHKDWLSSMPVTSPESLAHVLPLFRRALDLCENHSEAVEFPIHGLQPALAHLHKQVGASLQSLEGGQWQATAEGQWYAQRHGMARARGEPDLQSWPALTQPERRGSGVDSYADLAQHCRDLQMQWQGASLRPCLPELEMRMALYGAYGTACATTGNDAGSAAGARDMAGHLDHAARIAQRISGGAHEDLAATLGAFHKFCVQQRNELLRAASLMQVNAIDATRAESTAALSPVLPRSQAASAAYDVLLVGNRRGDPLPDDWDHKPDVPARSASPDPAQAPSAGSEGDLSLAKAAREVAERARRQRQGAIELPADAPARAAHELQVRLAMLRQTELMARTADATIGIFHKLSDTLDSARPIDRPALVKRHGNDMRQLAAELRQALQALDDVAKPSPAPEVRGLLDPSQAQLRADLRLMDRMGVSMDTLDGLLDLRVGANQVRRRINEHGKELNLKIREISGEAHLDLIDKLDEQMARLKQHLSDEPKAMEAERESLDMQASGLHGKILCDKAQILGKLLLDWGTKALLRKGKPLDPERFMPLRRVIAGQPTALAKANAALLAHSFSSEHRDRYLAQIEINKVTQNELKELLGKLDTKLASGNTSGTAAGSSNAQASVAQLLGIPGKKGKPSSQSQPRRR